MEPGQAEKLCVLLGSERAAERNTKAISSAPAQGRLLIKEASWYQNSLSTSLNTQIPTAPGIGVLVEIDLGLQGSR